MNLQNIKIFLAIAELGSISSAANKLHFTQPNISHGLAQLEKELGFQLVIRHRGSRQITLTQAGTEFLPLASKLMDSYNQISLFQQRQATNDLRLHANHSLHTYLVPEISYKLSERFPALYVRLGSRLNRLIPDAVEQHITDIAFVSGSCTESSTMTKIPLYDEDIYLLCPTDTELPNRIISTNELDPHYEVIHLTLNNRVSFQRWHQQHFPQDVPPYIKVSAMLTIGNYLRDRRCWALVPASIAVYLTSLYPEKLTYRHMDSIPFRQLTSMLISTSYTNKAVIQGLIDCCSEYIDERPYLRKLLL